MRVSNDVKRGVEQFRVTLMCSEEDPTHCHRRLLVSRVLESEGLVVQHIRGDGHIDLENDLRDTPARSTSANKPVR